MYFTLETWYDSFICTRLNSVKYPVYFLEKLSLRYFKLFTQITRKLLVLAVIYT